MENKALTLGTILFFIALFLLFITFFSSALAPFDIGIVQVICGFLSAPVFVLSSVLGLISFFQLRKSKGVSKYLSLTLGLLGIVLAFIFFTKIYSIMSGAN